MATKPTDKPILAQNDITLPVAGTDNKIALPTILQDNGWDRGEQPAAQHHNWLFNNIYLWVDYFDKFITDGDLEEAVEDFVGGMLSGAQNGISVTYDDVNGRLDFDVNDPVLTFNGAVTGTNTITNLGNTTFNLKSNPLANFTRNFIDGFQMKSVNLTPYTEISVGDGTCSNSDNTEVINLASQLTKDIVSLWTQGDNGGARPAAVSLVTNTWYPVFAIGNTLTGDADIGIDDNLSATNLLATATGYDIYRRIGWIHYNSDSEISAFEQYGENFFWNIPLQGDDPTTVANTPVNLGVMAPPSTLATMTFNVLTELSVRGRLRVGSTSITFPPLTEQNAEYWDGAIGNAANFNSTYTVTVPVDSNREVQIVTNRAAGWVKRQHVLSWLDTRGRQ